MSAIERIKALLAAAFPNGYPPKTEPIPIPTPVPTPEKHPDTKLLEWMVLHSARVDQMVNGGGYVVYWFPKATYKLKMTGECTTWRQALKEAQEITNKM